MLWMNYKKEKNDLGQILKDISHKLKLLKKYICTNGEDKNYFGNSCPLYCI